MLDRKSVYFAYVRLHCQGLGLILAILHIDIIICYTAPLNDVPQGRHFLYEDIIEEII